MMAYCNLLPLAFQRRLLLRRRLILWCLVWVTTGIAVGGFALHRVTFMMAAETKLAALERRCAPLRATVAENERFRRQIQEMTSRQTLAGELEGAQYPLELLGLISLTAQPFADELHIRRFALSQVAIPAPPTKLTSANTQDSRPALPRERTQLTIACVATDGLAIARFVTALRETRVFNAVEMKAAIGGLAGTVSTRECEVSCVF